jgi:hypothetical protein
MTNDSYGERKSWLRVTPLSIALPLSRLKPRQLRGCSVVSRLVGRLCTHMLLLELLEVGCQLFHGQAVLGAWPELMHAEGFVSIVGFGRQQIDGQRARDC